MSTAFRKGESPTKLNAVCQKVDQVDREPADREDDHLSIHENIIHTQNTNHDKNDRLNFQKQY